MKKASTIGLDLAKNVFQVHGADEAGAVVFRIKLRRDKLLAFFADHPPCVVAMEACASSNHWAREIAKLGHQTFTKGRDFAAWVGLTPSQHSSGGKERLGRISKMGERTLRRLFIIGAAAIVRWAVRGRGPANPWLMSLLGRTPRMLATVALANKMARTVWALMAHGGTYRAQAATA